MHLSTYLLPDFWACPLMYGDDSGLEDADSDALNMWLAARGLTNAACVGVEDAPEFTRWHDASYYVAACNCLEYTFATEE